MIRSLEGEIFTAMPENVTLEYERMHENLALGIKMEWIMQFL